MNNQNQYLIILKGTNKHFATSEFKHLFQLYYKEKIQLHQLKNTYYHLTTPQTLNPNDPIFKRLTFTKHLSKIIFQGNFDILQTKLPTLNLAQTHQNKKFAVAVSKIDKKIKIQHTTKQLAKPLYYQLNQPTVDLTNYQIRFHYSFTTENTLYLSEEIYHNDMEYLQRMPKYRPIVMPYTLKSDMARAAINLLNLKQGKILDPFCGIGGILLEAYDMNFEIIGNDISWNDLQYFKQNFDHYYPNSFKTGKITQTLADSSTQFLKENTIDGIISDIPYGKSCRKLGTNLYENFLKSAQKYLKPNARIVIIYANFLEFKRLAKKYFNEIEEIDHYINKSMTRHILVLENSKLN